MQHRKSARCLSWYLRIGLATALIAVVPLVLAAAAAPPAQPVPAAVQAPPVPTGTLDRVRAAGKLVLGYQTDARPMSYKDESGNPAGYSVTLCQKVADEMKANLGVATLAVEWVAVTGDGGARGVQQGSIDLLCAADAVTLAHREIVSFSIPIFSGGIAALLRVDGPEQFRDALDERPPPYQPLWRGSTPQSIQALQRKTAAVVGGTEAVELLTARIAALHINSTVAPVDSYEAGIAKVVDRSADVLFGDRAQLLDLAKRNAQAKDLKVLARHFTFVPLALALHRDDDAFRLVVDRSLSAVYAAPAFLDMYTASFGPADADTIQFFRMTLVPK